MIQNSNGTSEFYYTYADYLGSLTALANENGTVAERYAYDPWGNRRNPSNWMLKDDRLTRKLTRGYTGHEHLDFWSIINMNGRLYDPVTAQFFSPDPYVQAPDNWLNYNRYSYCLNNPFKYTDPSGEAWWLVPVIAAAVFAVGNTTVHAMNGDINNFGDGAKYFAQGAITGFALGCLWEFTGSAYFAAQGGSIVSGTSFLAKTAIFAANTTHTMMTYYTFAQAAVGVLGTAAGGFNDGWKGIGQGGKLFLGNFYLDENDFFGGIWQGFTRHSWELVNSFVGHTYSQARNVFSLTDRVEYWGGATFSIKENVTDFNGWSGVSLGNYINAKLSGNFDPNYPDGWQYGEKGLYLHEYGHTKDSRLFGIAYLPVIGISSASGAEWTEIRANNNIWNYLRKRKLLNTWSYSGFPLQ